MLHVSLVRLCALHNSCGACGDQPGLHYVWLSGHTVMCCVNESISVSLCIADQSNCLFVPGPRAVRYVNASLIDVSHTMRVTVFTLSMYILTT